MPHPSSPETEDLDTPNLLAELASAATQKIRVIQSEEQIRLAKAIALDQALHKIFKYFNLFSSHLNQLQPAIPRVYHIDNLSVYDALQWTDGYADYRKQSLADNAYLDHVSLRVKLTNNTPVMLKKRWYDVPKLKQELHNLGLRSVVEIETLLENKLTHEFFHVELAPDFQMRMQFQGNFSAGQIDLLCTNLESFGTVAFQLNPDEVSPQLLDEIGRFLMGRNADLPALLSRTRYRPEQANYR